MNEVTKRNDPEMWGALSPQTAEIVAAVVQEMMAPVMQQIGEILKRNSEAMDRIAASQQMMSARVSELEKQMRLRTPMSRTQEKCLNEAIRRKAREALDGKGFADDKKAVTKLSAAIRKSLLLRWGCGSLREAPSYDYDTAMKQIEIWNDILTVREIVREARERANANE